MDHVRLGGTGIKVSPLCLGAMMFGSWGNPDHDECVQTIHAAIDAGINFIDTANVYSAGESEEIVGKALKGRRDEVVLATKFHSGMGSGVNDRGSSRRHIMQAVEDSLRRLDTDYIDLYQAHRPDPFTDVDQTLRALTDLVHQGKVRYIGSSSFPVETIVEARWTAEKWGLEPFVCEQPPYSILARHIERDVLPTARRYNMGVIVWSPLAGGWLSGKFRLGRPQPTTGRASRVPQRFDPRLPQNQKKYEVVEKLVSLAESEGISLVEMSIAWTLRHPSVTSSIVGPRTLEQLRGQLKAADLTLSDQTLDSIDGIMAPGETLNRADAGWEPPWLTAEYRRGKSRP